VTLLNNFLTKRIIGAIVYYSGLFYLPYCIKKLIGRREVTVLLYHRISDGQVELDQNVITTSQNNFNKQMQYLSAKFNVISFDDLYAYCNTEERIPDNSVIITFDDGYRDNYTQAYPILKKYDLKATIALTTGNIGSRELFWWDRIAYCVQKTSVNNCNLIHFGNISLDNKEFIARKLQEELKRVSNEMKNEILTEIEEKLCVSFPEMEGILLSWEEIIEMSVHNITFAAHTVSHPILTRINFSDAEREIMESKIAIESEVKKKVNVFVYPNGKKMDMSKEIDYFLGNNGFNFSLSTQYGTNTIKPGLFRLRRVSIEPDDNLLFFKIKIRGFGRLLAPLYEKIKKSWLK
jgi:peptidoglycan/xylan/chitin deacetylase (PgdA/CDA1 family)